jgi:4-nitrophenyl phosphatase
MRSASPDDAERLSAVVVGIDFDFNYEKARLATLLIRAGVPFIGTNPDTSFPAPEGLLPGAGSLVQMIAAASDTEPVIIGKPAPRYVRNGVTTHGHTRRRAQFCTYAYDW